MNSPEAPLHEIPDLPSTDGRFEIGTLAADLARLLDAPQIGILTKEDASKLSRTGSELENALASDEPELLDVPSGSILVISDYLECMEDAPAALARAAKMVKPAAILLVTTERDLERGIGENAQKPTNSNILQEWNFSEARALADELEGWTLASQSLTLSSPRYFERAAGLFVLVTDGSLEGTPDIADLLATGMKNLRLDTPELNTLAALDGAVRTAVVTEEIYGPSFCGGIGTAYTSLVDHLALIGHAVTVVFIGRCESPEPIEHWVEFYKEKNITLVPIDISPLDGKLPWEQEYLRRGYLAYRWLKEVDGKDGEQFDIIHNAECNGFGYYAALAKHTGAAFARSTLCIGTHGSTRWAIGSNHIEFGSTHQLIQDHTEKVSLELHDVLIGPSQYLIHWMRNRGWKLPTRVFQQQYVQPHSARVSEGAYFPLTADPRPTAAEIDEIVFFGRLETRKGLLSLIDALDILSDDPNLDGAKVTFLGKDSLVDGTPATEYIQQRSEGWPWELQCLTDKNQVQAVTYLKGPGRCAVIPSLVDNSPNTVYEAIGLEIPFITAANSGIPELMHPEDVAQCTFYDRDESMRGAPLAAALSRAFGEGIRPPRPAVCQIANEKVHDDWHEAQARINRAIEITPATLPKTTVAVLCQGEEGLETLLKQLDKELPALPAGSDVLVVADTAADREATSSAAVAAGATFVDCTERLWFGGLANRAAEFAKGDVVVYLRPGHVLAESALSTLVRATLGSGGMATGFVHFDEAPKPGFGSDIDPSHTTYYPVGAAPLLPLVMRLSADVPFAVTRTALETMGGFIPDPAVPVPGPDLFLHPALKHGVAVDVVPEVIAASRDTRPAPNTTRDFYEGERLLRAYRGLFLGPAAEILPGYLRALEQRFQETMVKYWDLNWRATEGYEKVVAELEEKNARIAELEAELAKG